MAHGPVCSLRFGPLGMRLTFPVFDQIEKRSDTNHRSTGVILSDEVRTPEVHPQPTLFPNLRHGDLSTRQALELLRHRRQQFARADGLSSIWISSRT